MSRLILTFEDIAAGALEGAKLADRVLPFGWRFVSGPLPSPGELKNAALDGPARCPEPAVSGPTEGTLR